MWTHLMYFTSEEAIAFNAITTTDLIHLEKGKAVIFDEYFVNLGHAYDTKTGQFQCPCAGKLKMF